MKSHVLLIGVILALVMASFFILKTSEPKKSQPPLTPTPVAHVTKAPNYFYPISDYPARLYQRSYGQYFKTSDTVDAPCGKPFQGFHTGDDLETTATEKNIDVPIVAVAKGVILQAGFVDGYGGLIVESASLSGDPVTIYYGHMALTSVKFKAGDEVNAGETLGNLGAACSSETDDARKHLHFAIKKGTGIDVRGYVPTKDILSNWLNPQKTLSTLVK